MGYDLEGLCEEAAVCTLLTLS